MMLKQGSFINKKFYKLLIPNILSMGAYGLNLMIDALVGGHQLGETALSAVSIVSPIAAVILFGSMLFSYGYAIIYGRHIGEFSDEAAYKTAFQTIVTSMITGLSIAFLLLILKDPFLSFFHCEGELYALASAYYHWMILYAILYPIYFSLFYLIIFDGDSLITMLGGIAESGLNIFLSIFLCRNLGIAGLGMATCASAFITILIYSTHLLRDTNSIHFIRSWSWANLQEAFKLSISRSSNYIFVAIVDIVMNKIIINTCGIKMIPAYSVINLHFSMFLIMDAVNDSDSGLFATFMGEKNNYAIHNLMRTCTKTLLFIGLGLNIIFFFLAEYIPAIYGIVSPEVVAASVFACRIMSFSAIPFGVAYFFYGLYPILGKPLLSLFVVFLLNFFCPLIGSIPMAYAFGMNGVSIGMAGSSFLVVILFVIIIRLKYGKEGFPLYLEDYKEEVICFDFLVTKEMIPVLRDKVKIEFDKHGYQVKQLELLVEEFYTRIMEKNPGKTVLSECALLFGESHVRIIIRDNGKIFNFVDEDNVVESLNAHVLSSLLEKTRNKNYILTTSFNRNGFLFEK